MRKFFSAAVIGLGLAALSGTAAARVDVGLYFGAPAPVYVPRPPVAYYPQPVYAPAPPVYVAPAPVYYGPPAYYGPSYYAPRAYYAPRGYYGGGWHRGWEGHRHHR